MSIERRIELWEIAYECHDTIITQPSLYDILKSIDSLKFQIDAPPSTPPEFVREFKIYNDIFIVKFFEMTPDRIEGVYGKGRNVDVPQVRRGDKSRNINLTQGEYIEFPSHFVIYSNGFAVFERNPDGPSPSTLGLYIQHKCQNIVRYASVKRVPRGDFLERLRRAEDVRSLILRLGTRGIQKLAQSEDSDMFSGLEKSQELMGFSTATIRLSMSRSRGGLRLPFRKKIEEILSDPDDAKDILRMEVVARMQDSVEVEVIRLLKNVSLDRTVRFKVYGDSKNLDRAHVFQEIYKAYSIFKRILEGKKNDGYDETVQEALPQE